MVCPKYEIASGSDRKAQNIFVLAADAIRKVVNKKTVGENVAFFLNQRPLALLDRHTISKFSGLPIRGVFSFSETIETKRFRRAGPARNRCVSGLGRDVFFGGRSRERSVLDRS